jgi:hypothetical protein
MNCEDLLAFVLGLITLFGFALFVILGLTFSEDKTGHPIYRSKEHSAGGRREKIEDSSN